MFFLFVISIILGALGWATISVPARQKITDSTKTLGRDILTSVEEVFED